VRRRGVGGFFNKVVPAGSLPVGGGVLAGLIVPDFLLGKIAADRPMGEGARIAFRLGIAGGLALLLGKFAGRSVALGVIGGAIAREASPWIKSRLGLGGFGDPDSVPTLAGGEGAGGSFQFNGAAVA
jgi:hypothetical protein